MKRSFLQNLRFVVINTTVILTIWNCRKWSRRASSCISKGREQSWRKRRLSWWLRWPAWPLWRRRCVQASRPRRRAQLSYRLSIWRKCYLSWWDPLLKCLSKHVHYWNWHQLCTQNKGAARKYSGRCQAFRGCGIPPTQTLGGPSLKIFEKSE